MENKVVILDTSVLIDYFRKKDKEKTFFVHLTNKFLESCISSIAEFEIYVGATSTQLAFWKSILQEMNVLPFDSKAAHEAVSILHQHKQKRKTIDKADLFIAAISLANSLPIATLNRKHFEHIDGLTLISTID